MRAAGSGGRGLRGGPVGLGADRRCWSIAGGRGFWVLAGLEPVEALEGLVAVT